MKVLKIYNSGAAYISDDKVKINIGVDPVETVDLAKATKEEERELRKNPKNKKLIDKIKAREP